MKKTGIWSPWATLRIGAAALLAAFALHIVAPDAAFATPTPPTAEQTATPGASATTTPEATGGETAEAAPAEPPAVTIEKGDTTWMMVSTILVLLMIVPGLALFYGGLVRTKNIVSMLMQVLTVTCVGVVTWVLWGYSLSFSDGGEFNKFVGGTSEMFMGGVDYATPSYVESFSVAVGIPEIVFVCFQMTFACITASLVLGGVAERMKFIGVVVFAIAWPILVYYPMAHMVWWWAGPVTAMGQSAQATIDGAGLIWGLGALDFAGGTVVHINSGVAALVGAIVLGSRTGYKKEPMPPHNLTFTLIGAGLLWVGWFGFNAGSNLESNGYAGLAMLNTFVATAAAALTWTLAEWVLKKKPSLLGAASGAVAGLVAVTPAAGFAGPMGALVLGAIVGPVCLIACSWVKNLLGYDDSLDAFGIHAIGGIVGAIGTGFVVNPAWGGAGVVDYTTCKLVEGAWVCGSGYTMETQVMSQLQAVGIAIAVSGVGSLIVFGAIRLLGMGRVSKETEVEGLDLNEHGEVAYHP